MATAKDVYGQIEGVQGEMDPYLANQGIAPEYFSDRVNELFNHNKGAIQNAAGLEAKAYALPGELMDQYDQEFGGNMGVSSMARMNSILKNIGGQFGKSNAAWNMVDKAKMRQEDLVKGMNDRYNLELQALQQKHNNLLPIWQQMYQTENRPRPSGPPAPIEPPPPFDPKGDGTGNGGGDNTGNNNVTWPEKLYDTVEAVGGGGAWDAASGWLRDIGSKGNDWLRNKFGWNKGSIFD